MKIEIAEVTPSNNEIMRKFSHKHAKGKERNRWHYLVREQVGPPKAEPIQKCQMTVTRFGSQLMDWDNMGGGLKFLLDALVSNAVIADDNPKVVTDLKLVQQIDRKNHRVLVEIWPTDPGYYD